MTEFVFEPQPPVAVPVRGSSAAFPVRRVYCVGRNYAAHAREMGSDPDREPPFFFCKPSDAVSYVADGTEGAFPYPPGSSNVHYEVEMVVAIGKAGKDIPVDQAAGHVFGYAIGLDMTRRDLQNESKKTGRPWETGKAFDHSAPIGPIVPVSAIGHPGKGEVTLSVNGVEKQRGDLSDLIWSVPEMVSYLSKLFELQPGDLIYSGTPEGVGPVVRGDVMQCHVGGVGDLTIKVV